MRTCVADISVRSMTSLLQPTSPTLVRAVFSAVLTRLMPSSTVRACPLLTVTVALPACLMACHTLLYWLMLSSHAKQSTQRLRIES